MRKRDWPDDTIHADGTVRTPIWLTGEHITPDQYEVVRDTTMRMRYGTRTVARAKPGTVFYDRMAAWPVAFEAGMKDAMRRHFPEGEYSIYLTGHSTGGPMVFFIAQRVPNVAGMIAVENSPFGFIQEEQHNWSGALGKIAGFERVTKKKAPRTDPFNELYIRTWRDRARYAGPEALGQEGPQALMRLPWLMEEIFDYWDKVKARPQFKAEYVITHNIRDSLEAAARAVAARLKMPAEETAALVKHYLGFPYPQTGPGAKPVPPVLFCITKDSRDHSPEVYQEVVLPMFASSIRRRRCAWSNGAPASTPTTSRSPACRSASPRRWRSSTSRRSGKGILWCDAECRHAFRPSCSRSGRRPRLEAWAANPELLRQRPWPCFETAALRPPQHEGGARQHDRGEPMSDSVRPSYASPGSPPPPGRASRCWPPPTRCWQSLRAR